MSLTTDQLFMQHGALGHRVPIDGCPSCEDQPMCACGHAEGQHFITWGGERLCQSLVPASRIKPGAVGRSFCPCATLPPEEQNP